MLKIKSPNPRHSGVTAGVGFSNGLGYTENEDLKGWFEDKGYTVSKVSEKDSDSKVKDLEEQIATLTEERDGLKARLEELEDDKDLDENADGGDDTGGNKGKGSPKVKIPK